MGEQGILHFGAIKLRAKGSATLLTTLSSLDDVVLHPLEPLGIMAKNNREPSVLANMSSQRGRLKITTTNFDEYFEVSKIIFFILPIYSDYPG